LTRWKRVDWAIEACADANVPLTIVGEGEDRRSLERFAAKRHAPATFVGHQSDPRPFFASSSVILNASTAEAMPLSILESLAMERPVVAFAAGGIPEIVQHEVTGWLVEDPSPRALSAALLRARDARDKLASMGAAARRFVADHASIAAMCRGYAREYEAMCPSR
jgi:glycosyltransferase involved in cell wall biosynthesis